jgi:hypothetical protein
MASPPQPRQPGESGRLDESGTALLADAAARARRYLDRLGDRAVAPSPEAVLALGELEFPLPETGLEPARVLAALDDVGSPATVASALTTNVHRLCYAALGFGRPQRCWRSLRMRARSRRWAASTSGWRAWALRQRR